MSLPKIFKGVACPKEVPSMFDKEQIALTTIDNVNWPSAYPYKPEVSFRAAFDEKALYIHYKVKENAIRARYQNDNDAVWTDSCVELFLAPEGNNLYYNIESNCIGTLKFAIGTGRNDRQDAPTEALQQIKRWSSLGKEAFELKEAETEWELALIVPFTALFKHNVCGLEKAKYNVYKCGDELPVPHFVSLFPIKTDNPDFHRPEFFGE